MSKWDAPKRQSPQLIEDRDDGNVRRPDSHNAIVRKRTIAALALLLVVLVFTLHNYHRSMDLQCTVDWRWFWVGELPTALLLVAVNVRVLRKGL